jgi:hypothetical protein
MSILFFDIFQTRLVEYIDYTKGCGAQYRPRSRDMDEKDVFITGLSRDFEDRARNLVRSTLTPVAPAIDLVALKMESVDASSPASIGYSCTILAKTGEAPVIRAEAQDCDEVLAVYRATTALLDQLPAVETGVRANRAATP